MKSFWLKEINTMSCSAVGMYVSPQIQIQPQNIKSWIKRNEKICWDFSKVLQLVYMQTISIQELALWIKGQSHV